MFEKQFSLRKITMMDLETTFEWVNDPVVRANSFSNKFISMDEHRSWFQKKILDSEFWFIFELNSIPHGVIRFDWDQQAKAYLVNYSLKLEIRGKGLGKRIIAMGLEKLKATFNEPIQVIGIVKNENWASRKTFLSLGFEESNNDSFSYSYKIILN